jgi:hypothetical protein
MSGILKKPLLSLILSQKLRDLIQKVEIIGESLTKAGKAHRASAFLRNDILLEQVNLVETPVFNRHIVVHADPVNALLAVHENHHADDFYFFVDQEIPELIVGLVHVDIMKESDTKAKKIR